MPRKRECTDCGGICFGTRCRKCDIKYRYANAPSKKNYQRFWHTKMKYGIDEEEFWAWWIVQQGRCFICKEKMIQPTGGRGQALNTCCLDHCHKTKQFRGLLCAGCNKGLGLFHDNPERLKAAAQYLEISQ